MANNNQQSTPVPSMLGGQLDDDYHWNSTIMSNQELYMYQKAYGGQGSVQGYNGFDSRKSYYSNQMQGESSSNLRNGTLNSNSGFNGGLSNNPQNTTNSHLAQ